MNEDEIEKECERILTVSEMKRLRNSWPVQSVPSSSSTSREASATVKLLAGNSKRYIKSNRLNLLEVCANDNRSLTNEIRNCGGNPMRFTRKDGDLLTKKGQQNLWDWIYLFEPEHVFVAFPCTPWSSWQNMWLGENSDPAHKHRVLNQRRTNMAHLILANKIMKHQIKHNRHFSGEQPATSAALEQEPVKDILRHTMLAKFDQCQVGLIDA